LKTRGEEGKKKDKRGSEGGPAAGGGWGWGGGGEGRGGGGGGGGGVAKKTGGGGGGGGRGGGGRRLAIRKGASSGQKKKTEIGGRQGKKHGEREELLGKGDQIGSRAASKLELTKKQSQKEELTRKEGKQEGGVCDRENSHKGHENRGGKGWERTIGRGKIIPECRSSAKQTHGKSRGYKNRDTELIKKLKRG